MTQSNRWFDNWTISDDEIEFLTGVLLEKETPLTLDALIHALIERRLKHQEAELVASYKDIQVYAPMHQYEIGQKLMFTALENRLGTVIERRAGDNPAYGEFAVIQVGFEDDNSVREFAADLKIDHKLNHTPADLPMKTLPTVDEIYKAHHAAIRAQLSAKLAESDDLISVGGKWFSRSLMIEVNDGHLYLAEAVLDLAQQPMLTADILEQIGGLGDADPELQAFSLNDALNRDPRFDEVGPVNTILWFLRRLEPPEVQSTPSMIEYHPVQYDPTLLSPELTALEWEIDDEWSEMEISGQHTHANDATILLIYPHRRVGTLPLNAGMRSVFPTARRTPRVYVKLVDAEDGEEYIGWVVRQQRYVFGLSQFYRKHSVPVGARLVARRAPEAGKIMIEVKSYRKRAEWVRLIVPKDGQIKFEEQKRSLSADYDDQMILGTDDIAAVDALSQATQQARRPLPTLLKMLLHELLPISPQGAVHAKTLYSALNVLRRCPPGPIFAALMTGGDFEHIGNHYWKLRDDAPKE